MKTTSTASTNSFASKETLSETHAIFDGQQDGERILYAFTPHPLFFFLSVFELFLVSSILYLGSLYLSEYLPTLEKELRIGGLVISLTLFVSVFWWLNKLQTESQTFVTDRRVIRFAPLFPCFKVKRALFWNEVLKIKGSPRNFLFRIFKIGNIGIYPVAAEYEDVLIRNAYYFEDLANYLDKILFTFKNKPSELANIRPFVTRPKGERY